MSQPLPEGYTEAGDHRGRGRRGEGGKQIGNKGNEIDCLFQFVEIYGGKNNFLLQMSIRSGGHDYICASLKNDSLHLDLRLINVIDLLPQSEVPEKVSHCRSTKMLYQGQEY